MPIFGRTDHAASHELDTSVPWHATLPPLPADAEITPDNINATGPLYSSAAMEDLRFGDPVEHLVGLSQQQMLPIGAHPGYDAPVLSHADLASDSMYDTPVHHLF